MKRSFLFMAILACSLPSFAPDVVENPPVKVKTCWQVLGSKTAIICTGIVEVMKAIHETNCDVWNLRPEDR